MLDDNKQENFPWLPSSQPSTPPGTCLNTDPPEIVVSRLDTDHNTVSRRNGHIDSKRDKLENCPKTSNDVTESHLHRTTAKKPGFLQQFTGRTRKVLVMCSLSNFLASCASSLLPPFFPIEAAKKGMSLTIIGFVFSVFQLVIFIASPIIGTYLTRIGAKFVYMSGIFIGGSCVILFGVLDKCPDGAPFIATSIACMCVEALGYAAFFTASFAIISNECRDAVSSAFAIFETFSGMGYMIGPVIGGVMYQLGGYGLPFYIVGTLTLLNGVFIYNYLPKPEVVQIKPTGSAFRLLKSPMVVFSLGSVLTGQVGFTLYGSLYATHMERFGLSTAVIGFIYIIPPGLYTIVGPLWGYLTDHKNYPKPILITGFLLTAVAYFFMGPSPALPFLPNELWVTSIGLALFGVSFGMLLIPAMKLMVLGAYDLKYEPGLNTYAMVSGLFNSVNSFGGFLGPLIGGAWAQEYGIPAAFSVVSYVGLFMMVVGFIYFQLRQRWKKDRVNTPGEGAGGRDDETTLLIPSHETNTTRDVSSSTVTCDREGVDNGGNSWGAHLSPSRSLSVPTDVQ